MCKLLVLSSSASLIVAIEIALEAFQMNDELQRPSLLARTGYLVFIILCSVVFSNFASWMLGISDWEIRETAKSSIAIFVVLLLLNPFNLKRGKDFLFQFAVAFLGASLFFLLLFFVYFVESVSAK